MRDDHHGAVARGPAAPAASAASRATAPAPQVHGLRAELVGFNTIVIREFGRIIRIWAQTLVPPAITATLYFVIFGSLIGQRIGVMGGYTYLQYIAPGLIMMSVITNSYGNVVSSFFGAKFGKHIEEILVAPLPNWLIVAGYMMGGLLRGLLVGAVVTVIALLFTHLHVQHFWVVVSAALLSSMVFALAGMINAVFARNFDQITFIPTFILTPLTYLGGVFYTIQLLPDWARTISHGNQILYMVNAFRFGFLGVSDVNVGLAYAIMLGAVVVLYTACVILLNRGVGTKE
jgi:ABC-2 type transport system permease protein